VKTRHLQLVTPEHSVTIRNRSRALSPFGPLNPDSTTWRVREIQKENQDQQLTELLSSLERKVADLIYKSCTVSDTLTTVTQRIEVVLRSDTTTK
jgi:hypothetical protein